MDLVSVIIPYFKKKKFINKTLDSVQKQTYQNIEIILIYDDSDNSDYRYIVDLTKNDKRIKILKNTSNLGAGESRNLGIKSSKGKFIAFIDADDIWHEKKLEIQLKFMSHKNHLISHSSYKIINESDKIIGSRTAKNFLSFDSLLKSCDIGLSTVLLNKEILTKDLKFPPLKTKEDFVLWLKILKENYHINGLDENLVFWRKLDNSLSSSLLRKLRDGFLVYYKYMNFNLIKSIYLLFCLCLNFLRKND